MELLVTLSQKHRNVTVVGDDDQSIYGWRGQRIRSFPMFEASFPSAEHITLDETYRST